MYQDRVINNSRTNCRARKRKKLFPSCQLVFDCLQDNVCTPFKGYFTKIERNINTRNNGCSLKLPKAKLEFGRRSFAFQGALVYNTLPRHLRNLNSMFLFKSNLKEFFQ